MNALLNFLCVLAFTCCGAAALATNDLPIATHLTIELSDGSRVIGENGDKNYQFQSETLGEIKLPLEHIRSIERLAKTNLVKLTTSGGDTLTAQFAIKEIRVETTFGNLKLPVNLIKRIQVSASGNPGFIRPGLMALWSGNGNADDSVGDHNGALLNGTGFTEGKLGEAFTFSGVNQCIKIPFSSGLIATNFSISAWIKPASQIHNPDNQAVVFGQSYGCAQLAVRTGTTGVRAAFQFGTDKSTFYDAVSTSEIPFGQFSHIVGTWDGNTLRLYINGILSAENTPNANQVASDCPFYIGGFFSPATDDCQFVGQFFDGTIDEVAVYNRALSNAEIKTIGREDNNGEALPPPLAPAYARPFNGRYPSPIIR